jgi:hypothetical protein
MFVWFWIDMVFSSLFETQTTYNLGKAGATKPHHEQYYQKQLNCAEVFA